MFGTVINSAGINIFYLYPEVYSLDLFSRVIAGLTSS